MEVSFRTWSYLYFTSHSWFKNNAFPSTLNTVLMRNINWSWNPFFFYWNAIRHIYTYILMEILKQLYKLKCFRNILNIEIVQEYSLKISRTIISINYKLIYSFGIERGKTINFKRLLLFIAFINLFSLENLHCINLPLILSEKKRIGKTKPT